MAEPSSAPIASPAARRPAAAWALTLGVMGAIAVVLCAFAPQGTAIDFAVFHQAGGRWLRGEELYRLSDGQQAFKYAPVFAAFFAPFSLLPQRLAWLLVNAISIAALVRVLRFAAARAGVVASPRAQALVLAMAAPYYGHLIWLGQSDGLVLWLLVESEAQAERRPLLSGALWALACLVKPPFLALLLVVVLLRQGRRLAGLALGAGLWLAAGALRYGLAGGYAEVAHAWPRLLGASTGPMVCWQWNQSVFGLVCTYVAPLGSPRFLPGVAAVAGAVLAAGLTLVAVAHRRDPARGRFALFALALYLGAFLSPLGWNTNLVAALPLACALAGAALEGGTRTVRGAALAAAAAVALLGCVDLLLLPFHLWEDTALTLLLWRQYGVAGLLLACAGLAAVAALAWRAPAAAGAPGAAAEAA